MFFELTDPNLPAPLVESVHSVMTAQSAKEEHRRSSVVIKLPDRLQTNNTVESPSKNTVESKEPACSKCNKREDLWQSLSNGVILCSNGECTNDRATVLPKTVTLNLVLPQSDWTEETKKTPTTSKIETNKTEWNEIDECIILEPDTNLTLLHGIGFVGMENLGNSCYMNSVMQMLFATVDFRTAYYSMNEIYERASNPFDDLDFQMAKLSHGLYSKHYCGAGQNYIRPTSFKRLVGRNHPEFSTQNQQDAEEFFRYLLELIDRRYESNKLIRNLSEIFKFKIENRTQCLSSDKVDFTEHDEFLLSLSIPLTKTGKMSGQRAADKQAEVRSSIRLLDCLGQFASDVIIDDFWSPQTKTVTKARRRYRLKTFPNYLVLHMQRFTVDDGRIMKIDCSLDVPQNLDPAFLRGETATESAGKTLYRLIAFISHVGQSAHSGHYVCYILKRGKWVLHNDHIVAESKHPPKDLAYMYLYQRLPKEG